MELKYFKDEIVLDESMLSEERNCPDFDLYAKSIRKAFKKAGFPNKEASIFYKRNQDRQSVIGIQIHEGDKFDLNNYLIFDAHAYKFSAYSTLLINDIEIVVPTEVRESIYELIFMFNGITTEFLNAIENRIQWNQTLGENFDVMKTVSLIQEEEESSRPGGLLRRIFGKKPRE